MPDELIPPSRIRLGAIGDETGRTLPEQIAALQTVGWRDIELRSIAGTAVADLSDREFGEVCTALAGAGLATVCLDSRIGNWARSVSTDLESDLAELRILMRRCHLLGTGLIRVMSYPNDGLDDAAWRAEVIRRMRILAGEAEQSGIVLVHENCAGWASREAPRMLDMLDSVGSPALRLLFDIGNGVEHRYDGHALLKEIVGHVAHVHVKDAIGPAASATYTLPGDGECRVADCLRLLLAAGYSGVWSVEPHLRVRPHDGYADAADQRLEAFVAYARRLEQLVASEVAVTAGGDPR
ncbi:sugar phosphate isomerase/epimerase [Actinomadura sp. KC216]|uniref:sugar phosphate isomerase/epimerase family protein n=1 Tax=Actinomadura sp. KC216 TaxID=2530370 RepID=UPI00104C8801|nr:sugar phosphate isomerase/epimerase family protein [Actinomadura sp. KC216]TDB90711.1 sugar phosphate isomerase/epimerase [Actinomadura sp. KC216]